MLNHQWDADPFMHIVLTLTPYLLNNVISSDKLIEKFTQFTVYQNPCLIHLSVSNLCLITKLWNVSHTLLILMSCEMYTAYVGFAGILLDI